MNYLVLQEFVCDGEQTMVGKYIPLQSMYHLLNVTMLPPNTFYKVILHGGIVF